MTKKSKISALIFALILCTLIVVTPIVGVTADADTNANKCGDNLYWELDEKGILTISGTGDMYDYSGPGLYEDGYGNYVFRNDQPWAGKKINQVNFESGITHIGARAFYDYGQNNMLFDNVIIPDGVVSIGKGAFECCYKLESVEIPDSVTNIGFRAFADTGLVHVNLPQYLTEIDEVFASCDNLATITIGNEVTTIKAFAFWTMGLQEIILPESVQTIETNAFVHDYSLEKIVVLNPNAKFGEEAIEFCPSVTIYGFAGSTAEKYATKKGIPFVAIGKCGDNLYWELDANGILTISGTGDMYDYSGPGLYEDGYGNYVFRNDQPWAGKKINQVNFESGITHIGASAFYDYGQNNMLFDNVIIPDGVVSIGKGAFEYCCKLESVEIPDSVTNIGFRAFAATGLVHVNLPQYLTEIDEVFASCNNLATITIGNEVTTIKAFAFWTMGLQEIVLPESVQTIETNAFVHDYSLEKIVVLNPNAKFEEEAIEFCPSVTIYGLAGSTAEKYATENGIPFVEICKCGNQTFEDITIDATCVEDGFILHRCNSCQYQYKTDIVPASGHSYISTTYPDRNEYVCEKCQAIKQEAFDGNKNLDPEHGKLRPNNNKGSNKVLEGNIQVVAFYVGNSFELFGNWSAKTIDECNTAIESGLNFIKENAAKYGVDDLTFGFTYEQIQYDTVSKWNSFVNSGSNARLDNILSIYNEQKGTNYSSVSELRKTLQEQYQCDEVIFCIMKPSTGTSIAFVDSVDVDLEEYVMLYKGYQSYNYYKLTASTVAHEILHLYGALDLYNSDGAHSNRPGITDSKEIMKDTATTTDISSKKLTNVTAYSVGWTNIVPNELYNEKFYKTNHSDIGNCFYFAGASVSLGSDFSINFYIDKSLMEDCSNTYIVVRKPSATFVRINDYVENDKYLIFTYSGITAAELGVEVSATIYTTKYNIKHTGATAHYSVKEYAYNQLAKESTSDQFKTLLVDMLNYGAAAQIYFGYDVENLVNAELTEIQKLYATQGNLEVESSKKDIINTESIVSLVGCTLALESRIETRYYVCLNGYDAKDLYAKITYFDAKGNSVDIIVEGDEFEADNNGRHIITFASLNATELRTVYSMTVYDSNGNAVSNTREYSVESYVASQLAREKVGTDFYNLLVAMMKYGDSAAAYFG